MVSAALFKLPTRSQGIKVTGACYRETCYFDKLTPAIRNITSWHVCVTVAQRASSLCMTDSGSVNPWNASIHWIIGPVLWPYHVYYTCVQDVDKLQQHLVSTDAGFQQHTVDEVVGTWWWRLCACVKANQWHFKHLLQLLLCFEYWTTYVLLFCDFQSLWTVNWLHAWFVHFTWWSII